MNNRINNNGYICPRCGSRDISEFDDFISCNKCNLDFDKKFLGVIDNENILSRQDLKGTVDVFDDDDEKNR